MTRPPEPASASGFSAILVAIDFSAPSQRALEHARAIARSFSAQLHLLHVLEPPAATGPYAVNLYAPPAAAEPDAAHAAAARLSELAGGHAGGPITTVATGRPAQAILDYASAHTIDLIVMGTQGRTGLSHLLLGSVAEHVVRSAPCPVLTVRNVADGRQQPAR